jgi:hypothetical protein
VTDGDQGAEQQPQPPEQRGEQPAWPPPHPSPPLPPPRGYGTPGEPPSRAPYVLGALSVVLVVGIVALVFAVFGGDDEGEPDPAGATSGVAAPTAGATTVGPPKASPTAEPEPSESQEPSDKPSDQPSGEPSEKPSGKPSGDASDAATCWDDSTAPTVDDCSMPTGVLGLRWVFPALTDAACGSPITDAGDGAETRVLCITRLADGSRAQLGFFEWGSTEEGLDFYDGQGLERTESEGLVAWAGTDGDQAKLAVGFLDAPYSVTLTYPASATLAPEDQARLFPRPAGELKGVPSK